MESKIIENQDCFAIVEVEKKTYVAIGNIILAEAQSLEHARELIEKRDYRILVGLMTIVSRGAVEEYEQFKNKETNEQVNKRAEKDVD